MEARPHDESFPKVEAERIHAMRRARLRYGLDLMQIDIDRIVVAIKRHDARFLRRQSLRRSHWLWKEGDQLVIVVFDESRDMVITFLTLEMGHMPPEWYPGAWERYQQRRAPRLTNARERRDERQKLERAAKFGRWLGNLHAARPA